MPGISAGVDVEARMTWQLKSDECSATFPVSQAMVDELFGDSLAKTCKLFHNHKIVTKPSASVSKTAFAAERIAASDALLIKRCRSNDQTAWDELVGRYQRLVFAIPRRAGLSEEQSADIFQDVFLTLFEKIDAIEQPDRIRSWMVTTAKFKTWAVVRNSKGLYSPATDEEMEAEMMNLRDTTPLADEALIELEEQHLIRTALKQLEEKCRQILSMIYLQEPAASYAAVAEQIGVGETSISPMRSRCLKKLAKVLEK